MRLLFFLLMNTVAPITLLMGQTTSTTTAPKSATPAAHAGVHPAQRHPATGKPALLTDDQKTVYAAGLFVYKQLLAPLNLSPEEIAIVQRAIADQAKGAPAEDLQTWGPKLEPFAKKRGQQMNDVALAKAAAEPGAVKTDSGIIYRQLQPGTGDSPKASDKVRVQYRGTLPSGTEFDSSYKRNAPAEFPLDHVIKCWTEGLQKMKVGEKAQLFCPAALAYGDNPPPGSGIPPGSNLTFEVELLQIVPASK